MSDETRWCCGCDKEFPPDAMISLDGYYGSVCDSCWATMTPFQRILLTMLACPGFHSEEGGLGIGYELTELVAIARKRFRAEHGHDPDYPCQQCDPAGHRVRQQQRKEARERKANSES